MNEQRYKRIVLTAAIVAVASIGIAAAFFGTRGLFSGRPGAAITVDEERTFSIDGAQTIEVFSTSADIRVEAGESGAVRLHLHGTVRGNKNGVPTLVEDSSGRKLSVGSRPPQRRIGFFSSDLVLSVYLPESYAGSLSFLSVSGDIDLPFGVYTDLSIDTTSGDIEVDDVEAGQIKIDTTSGEISVREIVTGDLRLDSTSGDISASGVLGEVIADTTSGAIELEYQEFTAAASIDGTSGDVQIKLPADAVFDLSAKTTSGDIECDFPITIDGSSRSGKNSLYGSVGEGGPEISISTVSGDIEINK